MLTATLACIFVTHVQASSASLTRQYEIFELVRCKNLPAAVVNYKGTLSNGDGKQSFVLEPNRATIHKAFESKDTPNKVGKVSITWSTKGNNAEVAKESSISQGAELDFRLYTLLHFFIEPDAPSVPPTPAQLGEPGKTTLRQMASPLAGDWMKVTLKVVGKPTDEDWAKDSSLVQVDFSGELKVKDSDLTDRETLKGSMYVKSEGSDKGKVAGWHFSYSTKKGDEATECVIDLIDPKMTSVDIMKALREGFAELSSIIEGGLNRRQPVRR